MRMPWIVIALVALILLSATEASAQKRVALVIDNSAYRVGPLANPARDADAVAAAFRELGFDNVLLSADVAAVFFAGHGTERDGRNYLIPVDARLERASNLELQSIALSIVLDQIAASCGW